MHSLVWFPRVSVVVPVYNVCQYLFACIESVLSQSFGDFEVLLVDDGSTDGSSDLCDFWSSHDARIKVIHKDNGGLSDARNRGVDASIGKYVVFVDSDDILSPVYLESLVLSLEQTGLAMAAFPFCLSFADGTVPNLAGSLDDVFGDKPVGLMTSKEYIDALLYHRMDTGAPCRIYERSLLVRHPFPTGAIFEDAAVIYRMVHDLDTIAIVPSSNLYGYRRRGGSITRSGASKALVESAMQIGKQVSADMHAWYPDDDFSAASCGFSINRVALMRTTVNDVDYRRALWEEIKSYRVKLLRDSSAKKSKRLAALISYLGPKPFLTASFLFEKLLSGR